MHVAAVAQLEEAHAEGVSLRESALALAYLSAEEFDAWVRPEEMLGGGSANGM